MGGFYVRNAEGEFVKAPSPIDLPKSYYRRRALVSDRLAACVLLCPARRPSRDALPRDLITDEALRIVLAKAIIHASAVDLAAAVSRECGSSYVARLLGLLIDNTTESAFVWLVDWYAAQLRELEQMRVEHNNMLFALGDFSRKASKEVIPRREVGKRSK